MINILRMFGGGETVMVKATIIIKVQLNVAQKLTLPYSAFKTLQRDIPIGCDNEASTHMTAHNALLQ